MENMDKNQYLNDLDRYLITLELGTPKELASSIVFSDRQKKANLDMGGIDID